MKRAIVVTMFISLASTSYAMMPDEDDDTPGPYEQIEESLTKLTKKWTTSEKEELRKLRQTANSYTETHGDSEYHDFGGGGTGAPAAQMYETARVMRGMVSTLEDLEKEKVPTSTKQQLDDADKRLNSIYKTLQTGPKKDCIHRDGIKQTQRAWLKYRDAWLKFAKVKYPNYSSDSISKRIIDDRIKVFNHLCEEYPEDI